MPRESTEQTFSRKEKYSWQAGRHMHKVASHRMPVLPCHTLERNFKNRARFLDSCGRTEWTVREIQQYAAKTAAVTLQM